MIGSQNKALDGALPGEALSARYFTAAMEPPRPPSVVCPRGRQSYPRQTLSQLYTLLRLPRTDCIWHRRTDSERSTPLQCALTKFLPRLNSPDYRWHLYWSSRTRSLCYWSRFWQYQDNKWTITVLVISLLSLSKHCYVRISVFAEIPNGHILGSLEMQSIFYTLIYFWQAFKQRLAMKKKGKIYCTLWVANLARAPRCSQNFQQTLVTARFCFSLGHRGSSGSTFPIPAVPWALDLICYTHGSFSPGWLVLVSGTVPFE